ncbi:uncharacterized protein LOC119358535 [Triticum dicoccoides]|uniref:uncharacterized protein LOC119358535 n=1 Tax=Triticum dicoccoides TaxID=85692 RepID=UPI00188FCDD8|nr:uncharacterized protein LOC119358535 [Triticum dicoccoides]
MCEPETMACHLCPRSCSSYKSATAYFGRSMAPKVQLTSCLCVTSPRPTSILEVRSDPQLPPSDHKIVATHLSRYCAYLVAHCPQLLPDFDLWCKGVFKDVKKEAEHILIGVIRPEATAQVKYQKLSEQLSTRSEHEVLKNGVEFGRRLVELPAGEEKAWEVLVGFWSEMILYVGPSDNLDGHAEAIARGGELITLLWALLGHLGYVSRPDDATADAATAC